MTTLSVIIDQLVAPVPGGIGRYAEEMTRALIETAPAESSVEGIVSASRQADSDRIMAMLPGLVGIRTTILPRRALSLAWQHGFTGMPIPNSIHAMSVLAPLRKHKSLHNAQNKTVVTVHDVVPWTHPETLTARGVHFHKALVTRAHKYADAVVVPTHAVAADLNELLDFSGRIHVIGGAVSSQLSLPSDASTRATRLGLPDRYILAVGTLEPRKGLEPLIRAMGLVGTEDVPLIIAGPAGWGDIDVASIARATQLDNNRVRNLGYLSDQDLAVVMSRASVFVFPSLAEGFGLPVIEAFSLGTPVVHSDVPAVSEVAAGAGLEVKRAESAGYPQRLADAIRSIIDDPRLAETLRGKGVSRSHAFSWQNSAKKVWDLHSIL